MAFVLTTKEVLGSGFCQQITGDLSGTEIAVAAVASKSHYITSITLLSTVANTVTISDNSGTPVVIFGPVSFLTTMSGGEYHIRYDKPLKVASGKQIDITTTAGDAVCIIIQGFTR